MKGRKVNETPKPIKRCAVFDRDQAKKDGKNAMDCLWKIAREARSDLSVTKFEAHGFEASLQMVEEELNSLTLPPGTQAQLSDEIG